MSKSKASSSGGGAGANAATAKDLVDKFAARVRHNIEVHLETLATDLYKALEDPGGKVDAKRAVAQILRAMGKGDASEGRGDGFSRLLAAMRMLDEANTLRGLIEGLGRGAAMEATRVAVLLVDNETLRPFGDFGFAVGPRPSEIALDDSPVLARAVRERLRVSLAGARNVDLPPFMKQSAGVAGLAIPVIVGGEVVALLYTEGPAGEGSSNPPWAEHVEVLSRHAAARLEAITSRRTVEVLGTPA